jgi:hypothetical protein
LTTVGVAPDAVAVQVTPPARVEPLLIDSATPFAGVVVVGAVVVVGVVVGVVVLGVDDVVVVVCVVVVAEVVHALCLAWQEGAE